ncbi:MAG: geranylgeranylglyceryl/heptaprenylglyceryl phosphate synthase [Thermoplasmata archaeon]
MNVERYLMDKIRKEKVHLTLIDPAKQEPLKAGEIAEKIEDSGSDGIMIGGSTNITNKIMDETILKIKERSSLPVMIFPSGISSISRHADAIFFMSMLNSSSREFLIDHQVMASRAIKIMNIEPVSMAYLVVEPGMTVGKVGKAILIKRDDMDSAVSYALAAQYFGFHFVYLEAGSGAPEPVPESMVKAVKNEIGIPLIVGGGIRDPEKAMKLAEAGADVIVTGTLVERSDNYDEIIRKIVNSIKNVKY